MGIKVRDEKKGRCISKINKNTSNILNMLDTEVK